MTKTKLTLCTLASLFVAGQAFAHTGVRDTVSASATATTPSYNGFTITHGCGGDSGDAYPVLGQSAVFPTLDRVVWRDAAGAVIAANDGTGAGIFAAPMNLGVTAYAGYSSPFTTTQEIVDPLADVPNVVEGIIWKNGAMEPKLNAITPFKVTIPKIIDPSVAQIKIRIGVINYCDFGKNAANDAMGPYKAPKDAFGYKIPLLASSAAPDQINVTNANEPFESAKAPVFVSLPAGNGDDNRQDWWFTALFGGSALYNDVDVLQPTYWTTLTVNNASATGTRVVSVEPTGAAFDAILTGPNTRPFTKGNTNL